MGLEETTERIGRGRSGIVFKSKDKNGKDIAIKVFTGEDFLGKSVNYFLTGAPNAYSWNEDACLCANYKREIVKELCPYWFGSKLRVAESFGINPNKEYKAYELKTEFVDGNHAALHHNFSEPREGELGDLVNNVMKPLQERLIEAGFDGLAWQAGLGNPAGLGNFLLEKNNQDENNWVWIDLESGVPPSNPLSKSFYSFYLPLSIKHRRVIFDDVDISKLREYVNNHKNDLKNKIKSKRFSTFLDNINELEDHQNRWKSMRRADRGITYQLKKEKITQEKANYYFKHPRLWYARETGRLMGKGCIGLVRDLPLAIYKWLTLLDWKEIASKIRKFLSSEEYRIQVVRNYIGGRIDEWEKRGQLTQQEANYLHSQLEKEVTSPYLIDLFVHAVPLKIIDWGVMPPVIVALYASGILNERESAFLGFWWGSISRTAYTTARMIYSATRPENLKKIQSIIQKIPSSSIRFMFDTYHTISDACHITQSEGPKEGVKYFSGKVKSFVNQTDEKILGIERIIALGAGMAPIVGTAAYPVQMLSSGKAADIDIGKFILYDFFTGIGRKIPIVGGENSGPEHRLNRVPSEFIKKRKPLDYQQYSTTPA